MEPDDARCVGACSDVFWATTTRSSSHQALRRTRNARVRCIVDASPVRIPVPVRSWPRWSRRIPTRIAHGIGHGDARVFMETIVDKAVLPRWRLRTERHAAGVDRPRCRSRRWRGFRSPTICAALRFAAGAGRQEGGQLDQFPSRRIRATMKRSVTASPSGLAARRMAAGAVRPVPRCPSGQGHPPRSPDTSPAAAAARRRRTASGSPGTPLPPSPDAPETLSADAPPAACGCSRLHR